MSALIFAIEEEVIYLAADTLAISADDHQPFVYTTKLYFLPHLNMVLAGTGLANAVVEWFTSLNSRLIARDIDDVDRHVPRLLRQLWTEPPTSFCDIGPTVTMYHFGYSEAEKRMVAYAYRSERDFQSERFTTGVAVKPAPETFTLTIQSVPEDFVETIKRLAEEDRARPALERIGIGGDVQFCTLMQQGCQILTVARFDTWEDDYRTMCERLK